MEAPSGRRDLAGYMFLGVFVEMHVSTKVVVSFPDSLFIYSFFCGCFSKTAKKSQIIYFISTLPVTNSLHLKTDGWNTFSFPFGALKRPIFRCHLQPTKAASSMACRSLGVGDLTRSTWLEWFNERGEGDLQLLMVQKSQTTN